jgi:hypothetical protein
LDEEDDEYEEGKERKRKGNETFLQSDSSSVKGFCLVYLLLEIQLL